VAGGRYGGLCMVWWGTFDFRLWVDLWVVGLGFLVMGRDSPCQDLDRCSMASRNLIAMIQVSFQ